ncbi:MAG: hypothetical protein WC841_05735 [Candidatus Shapirobacteria bacterium]|jgi:hypothetical protein
MKKTIATLTAVAVLLAVAVPVSALTRPSRMTRVTPDINANVTLIESEVEAEADSGDNNVNIGAPAPVRETNRMPCFGPWCHEEPEEEPVVVTGIIDTGEAWATARGGVTVGRQENGCCDEGCTSPCNTLNRCGGGYQPASEIDVNLVMVDSEVEADADSGDNRLTVRGGNGYLYTGRADALAEGSVVVNAQVNDLN